jgi:hypothetical protein
MDVAKPRMNITMDDLYRIFFVALLVILIVLIYRYYAMSTSTPGPVQGAQAQTKRVDPAPITQNPLVNATELPNYITAYGFDKDTVSESVAAEKARIDAEVKEGLLPDVFKAAMKATKEPSGNPGKDFSLF